MNALQNPFALLARLLMAVLFLPAGISKISGFAGTAGYIGSVGLPMPEVGAALAILVEVGASILLVIGLCTRPAALVLGVFTLVASFFFHNFWAMPADAQMMQSLMFFKNIAIVGGLLAIAAFGAGGWSLDAKRGA
ncbi:DoxX family protein [Hydrogenophaga sp. YM1]|jgi:putative oxidoreductase|uniref:DoxX family protein n=1 Tax=Hydrogenophaga TaxID=47420 RepID=UPI00086B2B4C|nr:MULTISPECIES: DoxX family protein [unclassified Hydrogenophaga]MBN9373139.1 DoxX family protein [Hydrogenophaga sp.]ODT33197.1 MAG: DoxX family protein [Hydrogenophaga sp. SCN 70-13]OJV50115.1 MAG: DoxX family protein [Hydrogenophaga sp. 70-12]QRR35930.1 DoxX family protein [Hydrogenophaga sp. YM1]